MLGSGSGSESGSGSGSGQTSTELYSTVQLGGERKMLSACVWGEKKRERVSKSERVRERGRERDTE